MTSFLIFILLKFYCFISSFVPNQNIEAKSVVLELTTGNIKYHCWLLFSDAFWDLWDASQVITAKWHYNVAACEEFVKTIWSPGNNFQQISLVVWLAECVKYCISLFRLQGIEDWHLSKSWVHGWDSGCLLVRDNACMCQWVCFHCPAQRDLWDRTGIHSLTACELSLIFFLLLLIFLFMSLLFSF